MTICSRLTRKPLTEAASKGCGISNLANALEMKTFTCPRHDLQLNTFPRLSRILWYQITTRSRLSLVFRWCKWSGILKQRANYCTWALGFKRLEQPKDGFISRYLLFIQSILQRLLLPMGRKVFILPGNLAEELRHLEPRIWLLRWACDEWFHIEQPQEKAGISYTFHFTLSYPV